MSNAIAVSAPPKLPQADKPKEKRALKVSGRLKDALNLMVFGPETGDDAGIGMDWLKAARTVNYAVPAMRRALEKPHVIRYLREQKQVFRAAASAQNISYAVKMRAQSGNAMAQLGAMKFIEETDEQHAQSAAIRSPGVVIQIVNQGPNDGKPLQTLNVVPNSRSVDEPE